MIFRKLLITCLFLSAASAHAAVIEWTDWKSAVIGQMAIGAIGSTTVTYGGHLTFAQTGSGTNYWTENGSPAPYTGNTVVDNVPTPAEMLAISGTGYHQIVFSEAILNPVMAIVSMGQPSIGVSYDFDTDFDVLGGGVGYWSGANGGLPGAYFENDATDTLTGYEFHGVIQFNGLIEQINWTSSPNENWHGFTFGKVIDSTSVPEPTSLALLAVGLAGFGFSRYRNK
ncbi:MAG: PEP-CTERM sorting domain-containing protein [Gammaproteobacteria bacterium]|nr:PEP-CTERM sorting domain-containing protein [Gammaproteobacteria bacterium]